MNPPPPGDRLSDISTLWTAVLEMHRGTGEKADAARVKLIRRYSNAIYRYLLAALRDRDEADDLFQEFALSFLRGGLKGADPTRGRFRNYLRTALYHLIVDYQRRRDRRPEPLDGREVPVEEFVEDREGDHFLMIWRFELVDRAWDRLRRLEERTGQPLHTVLRYKVDHPEERSSEAAAGLSRLLQRDVSPEWYRKRVFLAREKFADLLLDEVRRSLDSPTVEMVDEELILLGLKSHCQSALRRRYHLNIIIYNNIIT